MSGLVRCSGCRLGAMPRALAPMLSRPAELPVKSGWHFEFKWDGVRVMVYWDGRSLTLVSRSGQNVTGRYPELHDLGLRLGQPFVLDGEIVALDRSGYPSFGLLQHRMHAGPEQAARLARVQPVRFYPFDILFLEGWIIMDAPYAQRRYILERLEMNHPRCQVPPSYANRGMAVLETARQHGLEGVVAKHGDSRYEPGRRSGNWRKIKLIQRHSLVVGGWRPQSSSGRVGSLLLGYYNDQERLMYAGSVGSGFSDEVHGGLHSRLGALSSGDNPFAGPVPKQAVQFVRPQLVVEVEYRRWPPGGLIQQAAFKGLRDDKAPEHVVKPNPVSAKD